MGRACGYAGVVTVVPARTIRGNPKRLRRRNRNLAGESLKSVLDSVRRGPVVGIRWGEVVAHHPLADADAPRGLALRHASAFKQSPEVIRAWVVPGCVRSHARHDSTRFISLLILLPLLSIWNTA